MLTITTPATDKTLLTIEELRLAAGVATGDTARDAELNALGIRLAADITTACRVAIGNGAEPTLRQEVLKQVFRCPRRHALVLARRHNVEIVSITIDGDEVADTLYEVESEAGMVYRLTDGGDRACWSGKLISVSFKAGFVGVPADLSGAATDLARIRLSEGARDPMVRGSSMEVPDILIQRTDYWVGTIPGANAGATGPVPASIARQLTRFVNYVVG